ncbi:MAG: PEP-utilizing enzyme [Patescibacteria group bacterium]
MKSVRGLVKKNLKLIKNKKWYHQRFDGSPHFLLLISAAELTPEARKLGCHCTSHFGLFEDDKADWYIDQADIDRISKKVIASGLKQPHFSKELIKKWQADKQRFFTLCRQIDKTELKKISDNELKKLYQHYTAYYVKAVSSSSIIDGFALGTDQLIQQETVDLLNIKKIKNKASRYFSVLTAPISHSFINEVEVSLLKIGADIEKITGLKSDFQKKPIYQLVKIINKYPKIYQLLKKQENDYYWSKNNYVHNNYLDVNKWVAELKTIFLSGVNINDSIKQIIGTPKNNINEKRKLIKYLKPSKLLKVLLEISEDFTYWQDERKKQTYWSTHYGSLLLKEIGRRYHYILHEMKYFSPSEVVSIFSESVVDNKEIKGRMRKCLWYQKGENSYEVTTENDARQTLKQIFAKKSLKVVNDFRGLSASRGVARGPVKIIRSATETNKVKEGDILVAVMTRPDYIVGIKKASAIVTNEGGVTCHAAIVSRELNIPCVIGTKIATEVLHDGDIVEVNGNHGLVTVVKKYRKHEE